MKVDELRQLVLLHGSAERVVTREANIFAIEDEQVRHLAMSVQRALERFYAALGFEPRPWV